MPRMFPVQPKDIQARLRLICKSVGVLGQVIYIHYWKRDRRCNVEAASISKDQAVTRKGDWPLQKTLGDGSPRGAPDALHSFGAEKFECDPHCLLP